MKSNYILWFLPIIFFVSLFFTYLYIFLARNKKWIDIPGHRSSHQIPTPRGGGLVFIVLWLLCGILSVILGFWDHRQAWVLLPGASLVSFTAFYDDVSPLSAKTRALFYILASFLCIYMIANYDETAFPLGLLNFGTAILYVLAIAWSINLFNFMDGLDGFAALEGIFVLSVGGFFLWEKGGQELALMAWLLAVSVAGFLFWNRPPAKVFMGDVGSTTLGFSIMAFAFLGEKVYGISILLWLILYGTFIFDSSVTLARRIYAGEIWYQAHRSHAYQRLHQTDWPHSKVLLYKGCVNIILVTLALIGFYNENLLYLLFLLALILLTILYIKIESTNPMYLKENRKNM
jgi:Fuc2NAc and GlcNAc transferase